PAVAAEAWSGKTSLPDPSPDGLIVGPEVIDHPGHIPEFIGERGEPERLINGLGRHRSGLPSRPLLDQIPPGLRVVALTLGRGPRGRDRAGMGSDGTGRVRAGEPLEKSLQGLPTRDAGAAALEGLQHDPADSDGRPTVDRAEVGFPAPTSLGDRPR